MLSPDHVHQVGIINHYCLGKGAGKKPGKSVVFCQTSILEKYCARVVWQKTTLFPGFFLRHPSLMFNRRLLYSSINILPHFLVLTVTNNQGSLKTVAVTDR